MVEITRKISEYNHSGRNGQAIKYIVMHYTGTRKTDTAMNNAIYFGRGNRDASAHYFVDTDSIVQVVEDGNASWNCGDGNGKYGITNQNSLAIEMCGTDGTISAATEDNALDLVKFLMNKYNIASDRVVRHYDASRKVCPAPWSRNEWSKWNDFKSRLLGSAATIKNTVCPSNDIDVDYQVHTGPNSWLPWVRNLEDYAGIYGTPIDGIKIKPTKGVVKYRVHLLNGDWLPWVRNLEDYAGLYGRIADGIQLTTEGINEDIEYRVYVGGRWLPWVRNLEDYAGIYGVAITGVEMRLV